MPELTINVRIAESGDLDATAQRIGQKISGAAQRGGGGGSSASSGSRRKNMSIVGLPTESEVKEETEKIFRTRNASTNSFYDSEIAANMRVVSRIVQDRRKLRDQVGDPDAFGTAIARIGMAKTIPESSIAAVRAMTAEQKAVLGLQSSQAMRAGKAMSILGPPAEVEAKAIEGMSRAQRATLSVQSRMAVASGAASSIFAKRGEEVEREGNQVVSSVTRSAERIARAQNAAFGVINVSSARVRQALKSSGGGSGGGSGAGSVGSLESGATRDILRAGGIPFGTARGLGGEGLVGGLAVGAVVAAGVQLYNSYQEAQKTIRETMPDIGRLGLGSGALMGNAKNVAALHGDIRANGSILGRLGVPGYNLPKWDIYQAQAALLGGSRAAGPAATEAQLADITGNIDLERRKRGKTPEEVSAEIAKDVSGIPLDRRGEATQLESRARAESASGNYGAASRDQRSFNALVASQSERISNVKVAGEYTKQADAAELENLASARQSGQKLNELRVGLAAETQGASSAAIYDPNQRAAQEQSDILKQRDAKLLNLKGDYSSALESVKDAGNQEEKYSNQWNDYLRDTKSNMLNEPGREGTIPTDNEVAARAKSLPEGAQLFAQLTGAGLNVAQAQSAADKIKNNQPDQITGITEAAQAQIDTIATRAKTEEEDRLFASTSRGIELEAAALPVAQQRIAAQNNLSRELSKSRISQNLYNRELENTNTEFNIAQRRETAGNISAVGSSVLAERAAAFNFPGRTRAEQFSEQNFDLSVSSGFLTKQMENAGPLEKARLGLQRGTLQAQAGALGQGNLLAVGQSVDAGGNPLIEEANAIRNRRNQANRGAQFLEGLRNAPAYNDPDFNQARANLLGGGGGGGGGMDQGLNGATAALATFTAALVNASKAPLPSGGGGSTVPGANK